MKKSGGSIFTAFAAIAVFAAIFCGWTYASTEKALRETDNFYYYAYDEEYSNTSLSADELRGFESEYKEYSCDVYYSLLDDGERLIYDSVVYAFENNDSCLFIPESCLPTGEYTLTDILYFVALDSPLIEQNIAFGNQSDTSEIVMTDLLGLRHTKEVRGAFLYIDNFTEDRLNNKKLAIGRAREIIGSAPSDAVSDGDKVRYYFYALAESSDYIHYDYETMPEFLYDALAAHGSNCDGFANAFSLICNMSGIPCFEKMTVADSERDGHTWNCVLIDGVWYNVDVTGAVDSEPEMHSETYLFFPDAYSAYDFAYRQALPECADASLSSFDCAFTSESDAQIVKTLVEKYRGNQSRFVRAHFENITESRANRIVDMFFNQVSSNIEYYTDGPLDGGVSAIIINSA